MCSMESCFTDITFFDEPVSGVRYSANMNTYNECLYKGRYVAALRSVNGRSKVGWDGKWDGVEFIDNLIGKHEVEAFLLEIDGQLLDSHWKWENGYFFEGDERHSVVELTHTVRPVRVKVHTKIDGSRFFERWLEITNEGDRPAALSKIYPISGLLWKMQSEENITPNRRSIFTAGYYEDNQWGYEGDFRWKSLDKGTFAIQSKNGRSGWGVPFFLVRNEINGEYFCAHLEWACNWEISFTVDQNPRKDESMLFFKIGPAAPAVMRVMEAGETMLSPKVHLGHLKGSFDDCVQDIHAHLRESVLLKDRKKALLFGQGRVVSGDTGWLKRQIDVADRLGMQFFFVDAGWYGYTFDNWFDTVGDWNVGEWLNNSMDEIREYIHEKGMLFGLWMEPETAGSLSKFKCEHPDWFVKLDDTLISGGRLIDLSKPEAAEWVERQIDMVLKSYKPDIFKLDYNCQNINSEGDCIKSGFVENTQWRHVEAIYGIFDRLRLEYPNVIFENCAAGGGRLDLGMVKRFHQSCQSDYTCQPRNIIALNNLTIAFPPEVFKFYYMMQPDYYYYGDFDFIFRVMMLSNAMVLDFSKGLEDMNEAMERKLKYYMDMYSNLVAPILPTCKVYHHTPVLCMDKPNQWCVLEYMSCDRLTGYTMVFSLTEKMEDVYCFRPKGLEPGKEYSVKFENTGYTFIKGGFDLMNDGIKVNLDMPLTSEMLVFHQI